MYNSFMNGYSPGYGTGYNQNNYGNYGMMQSQIPAQSIAQASPQSMQTGQGYNYPSNAQNGVRVFSVGSYDEAKAIPIDFSGDMLILTDLYHGRIYTKVYDAGLKESIFRVYQVINPNTQQPQIEGTQQVITAPQEQNPVTPMYDPKPDIKNIYSEIENIKKELGIKDAQQQKSIVPVKENEQ